MPPQRSEDSASLGVNFLKLIYRFNAIPVKPSVGQWRNRHREQTDGHRERGGEGETLERVTGKLTSPYVK